MPLKPLDIVVCLALSRAQGQSQTYAELAAAVGLSASEANAAVRRASASGLLQRRTTPRDKPRPNVRALLEFLEHGVRYAFFAEPGALVRGMPTADSAPPLNEKLAPREPPVVWPDPEGSVRGQALQPLYRTVPAAARRNPELYELLALVDALRCGGARERTLAMQELERRIADAGND